METEIEKGVEYNEVKWSKNVKRQPQQNSDKKIQLPEPSRQSRKLTL